MARREFPKYSLLMTSSDIQMTSSLIGPSQNIHPCCLLDVLNVSGRFNSEELARDMTVGDDVKDEPFFDQGVATKAPQNVSALIGKTAFLTCVVRNLGKAKSVSDFFQLHCH